MLKEANSDMVSSRTSPVRKMNLLIKL